MELNKIYNMDCLKGMKYIKDNSIHLIFTSPPYGVGMEYGEYGEDTVPKAIDLIMKMATEAERILVEGGKLLINVPHGISRNPYYPFEGRVETEIYDNCGLNYRGKILWFKGYLAGKTAWGTWKSQRDPVLRDYSESVLVFCKGKTLEGENPDMTSEEFLEYTKAIWRITPDNRNPHPAAFPIELAKQAIKLYTFPNQIVLDPFIGSGTTAVAAKQLGRKFIGFEINKEYFKWAKEKLSQEVLLQN